MLPTGCLRSQVSRCQSFEKGFDTLFPVDRQKRGLDVAYTMQRDGGALYPAFDDIYVCNQLSRNDQVTVDP